MGHAQSWEALPLYPIVCPVTLGSEPTLWVPLLAHGTEAFLGQHWQGQGRDSCLLLEHWGFSAFFVPLSSSVGIWTNFISQSLQMLTSSLDFLTPDL